MCLVIPTQNPLFRAIGKAHGTSPVIYVAGVEIDIKLLEKVCLVTRQRMIVVGFFVLKKQKRHQPGGPTEKT